MVDWAHVPKRFGVLLEWDPPVPSRVTCLAWFDLALASPFDGTELSVSLRHVWKPMAFLKSSTVKLALNPKRLEP